MKKIKLIVEIESDGYSTNILINEVNTDIDSIPESLKNAIDEWHPTDIMCALYLAENE